VLAIDGGQSAIRVRHSEGSDTVELEGVSRLEGDTLGAVVAAVAKGWRQAGAPVTDRAVLGLTTAPTDGPTRRLLCEAVAGGVQTTEVWLADDAVTGHAGALSLDWGISVIVGTGVACLAVPREGTPTIIGGDGYLLGDEGGAFWVGSAGIRAVLKAIDGRGPSTALVAPAERHFDGLADLGDRIHSSQRPVDTIARFAPDVLAVAETGDTVAAAITDAAANELASLVWAAAKHLASDDGPIVLALGGRLVQTGPLRARLERLIATGSPAVDVRSADGPPLQGALLLGAADHPGRYRDFVYAWEAAA
jgi:N-acetylglucosamine kinase-like BadF-type ATPase